MIWLLNSWFWKKIKKCNTSLKTTNSTGWPLLFYKFVRFRQDKYLFWLDWQKWSFDWKGYRIVGICTIRSFIFQGPTPKICCSQFEEGNWLIFDKFLPSMMIFQSFWGPRHFQYPKPGFRVPVTSLSNYRYPLLIIISHAHLLQDQLFAFDLKLMCIQLCYYAH